MKHKDTSAPDEGACPCGSGEAYPNCCGRFIEGRAQPETAEALMRSRYTAFALNVCDYLRATWHGSTCPSDLNPDAAVRWIGLEILATEAGKPEDTQGWVEFVARYKLDGRAYRLRERSHFIREGGRWIYLSGSKT